MRRNFCFLMIAGLAVLMMQSCKKDDPVIDLPTVQTATVTEITEDGATTGGTVEYAGTLTEFGICWSTEVNPTVANNKVKAEDGQNPSNFTVKLTGLNSGTVYYVKAYAITSNETIYGDERSFTTEGQLAMTLPFMERFNGADFPPQHWRMIDYDGDGFNWYVYRGRFIGALSDSWEDDPLEPYNFLISPKITISGTNPKLEWNIGSAHNVYVEEKYKVVVSTTKFTEENCTTVGDVVFEETLGDETGRTLVNRSVNLSEYAGKDVYIAWVHYDCIDLYALVLADIRIGSAENPVSVTAPVMGSLTIGDIIPGSVGVSAIITSDGGVNVIKRGFCYSKSPNPTIDSDVVEIAAVSSNVLATYSADLTLESSSTYYVRAFAINALGITYSNEQTVVVPNIVKTVLFFEDFDENPFTAAGSQWVLIDKDGDGFNWVYFADDEDQCARSYSYDSASEEALTPENYLVLPPVTIPENSGTVELSFMVSASNANYYEESYEVLLSLVPVTIDNCRDAEVIKPLETLTKSEAGWIFTSRRVDITEFAGNTVYIIFVHKECSDELSFLLDNIEVASFK